MRVYQLKRTQILPLSLEEAWSFFSNPQNLNEITPDDMSFEILPPKPDENMYEGMIINYIVRPVLNIPMRWTTEIKHVKEQHYFVDEQRFGPYAFWHHKHFFEAHPDGVKMTDIVDYAIPFGPFGEIARLIFVEKKLNSIFDFRYTKLESMFTQTKKEAV